MSYTIWVVPREEKVRSYFTDAIADLSQKYQGPVFEPHTTILGDLELPLDEMQKKCEKLAQQTTPFNVNTGSVEYSNTYYQCVFVRIKPTPDLMSLYDAARQIFNVTTPKVFMPHLSLFYGNVPYSIRQEIIDSRVFTSQQFSIDSLIVTPGGEHLPSEWKHVLEIPFQK